VCPTCYQTRHFFNNSNTNEDIATKFEQGCVRLVRNEEECVCSAPNILISGKIIKEMPGSVVSGTHCICFALNTQVGTKTVDDTLKEILAADSESNTANRRR
jgi:hypothetical protein